MKKAFRLWLSTVCLLSLSSPLFADNEVAQTLTIYTHFKSIVGNPSWLIELRDAESGLVLPYLFEIHENKNYWLAFSKEHSYRVVASVLKFGPYVTINNFCGIENGILKGKSMYIHVTGIIAPDLRRTKCRAIKINQEQFTIVKPE
jgi:hypothetical protein